MKRINMTIAAIALFTFFLTNAHAGDKQVGGLLIGGGTGAIIGQAVGRSAESTIIGATVGGVVGLIVGSELERHHGYDSRHTRIVNYQPNYRNVYIDRGRYNHRPAVQYFPPKIHHEKRHQYYQNNWQYKKVVTVRDGRHYYKRVVKSNYGYQPRHHN